MKAVEAANAMQCIAMVNSDDDVDGDDGDDDDQEEKDDEESSLRMKVLASLMRRENNIYGGLRGVLLPHLPLKAPRDCHENVSYFHLTIITQSSYCD